MPNPKAVSYKVLKKLFTAGSSRALTSKTSTLLKLSGDSPATTATIPILQPLSVIHLMTDGVAEVPLPPSVDRLLNDICVQKLLKLPNAAARKSLSNLTEHSAIDVLRRIGLTKKDIYDLNGYIMYMVKKYGSVASASYGEEAESIRLSSPFSSSPSSSICSSPRNSAFNDSPTLRRFLESPNSYGTPVLQQTSSFLCSSLRDAIPTYGSTASHDVSTPVNHSITSPSFCSTSTNPNRFDQHVSGPLNLGHYGSPVQEKHFTSSGSPTPKYKLSQQSLILSELEFRKLFMVHSYIGSNKLEDAVSEYDALEIRSMKNLQMLDFEDWIWSKFGSRYCQPSDRAMYLDWDSGKTHIYTCYVSSDGGLRFKGPYLDPKKTHLQRELGDDNVLIVKFAEVAGPWDTMTILNYKKIAEVGILVGLRRYRFFVSKDGGRERQKDGKEEKKQGSSGTVKCYFVKRESTAPWDDSDTLITSCKTTHDVRCLFMHVHTVPSMAKYIARCSLILSTTIKLQVDLSTVSVEEIEDIPCIDENGCIVCDEDGEPLIQTDGTGFISEDLAVLVPTDFYDAKYVKDKDFENFDPVQREIGSAGLGERHLPIKEPPLLIQCRLYHEGSAVKGTLLVNKKLQPRTIQVRPSMIKVRKDPSLLHTKSFDSLEVNAVSHKPKTAKLSKYLIALLSAGGVPKDYFLEILQNTLDDTQRVCFDPRAAFRVAHIYQHIDDCGICMEMFGACIPLSEPYLRYRLSQLAKEERKGLGEGRIPISDSCYLMGTTDPTGSLNGDEVCIILENGQLSGKVLVYRNPGLHFGDIHVLNARYVKELEDYVGNSKYAIFFSTKGKRSVANEIATGDFDGDLYWVSKNDQLLKHFKACEPWKQSYSTPSPVNIKPSDLSPEELEHMLFRLLFSTKTHSSAAGTAADSWMVLMDRYLMLQDGVADADTNAKKDSIKEKMLQLIDLYYDALDAPKTGKKVVIPESLKATEYPHYMGRKKEYHSTSILGLIYDRFQSCKNEKLPVQEIWKLPYFNVNIPDSCLDLWKKRYHAYKYEMKCALDYNDQSKNDAANAVIKKYKQMFYEAPDFKDSPRNIEDLYNEALAIYHVSYDRAREENNVGKCGFAWKVAGSALCAYYRKIHCTKTGEREITFLPSSFNGIF